MTGTVQRAAQVQGQALGDRSEETLRPVFVGGCSRSGTTLLGAMLGASAMSLTVPEAPFKWRMAVDVDAEPATVAADEVRRVLADVWNLRSWGCSVDDVVADVRGPVPFRDVMGALVRSYGATVGRPAPSTYIDHTPQNVAHAAMLLDAFPDGRLIHIVRDGRGVAASVIPLDWGPNDVLEAARYWSAQVGIGFAAAAVYGPDRVKTVRFEDLLADPGTTLREVCTFCDVPFDDEMVTRRDYAVGGYSARQHALVERPPDERRADAWQTMLDPRQVEAFEYETGDLLTLLGYQPVYGSSARPIGRIDHARIAAKSTGRRLVSNKLRRAWRRRSHR
jgi:hypothetical protein